jgi:hypothetical protein
MELRDEALLDPRVERSVAAVAEGGDQRADRIIVADEQRAGPIVEQVGRDRAFVGRAQVDDGGEPETAEIGVIGLAQHRERARTIDPAPRDMLAPGGGIAADVAEVGAPLQR